MHCTVSGSLRSGFSSRMAPHSSRYRRFDPGARTPRAIHVSSGASDPAIPGTLCEGTICEGTICEGTMRSSSRSVRTRTNSIDSREVAVERDRHRHISAGGITARQLEFHRFGPRRRRNGEPKGSGDHSKESRNRGGAQHETHLLPSLIQFEMAERDATRPRGPEKAPWVQGQTQRHPVRARAPPD